MDSAEVTLKFVGLQLSYSTNYFLLLFLNSLLTCYELHKTEKSCLLPPCNVQLYDEAYAISWPQRTKNLANIQSS